MWLQDISRNHGHDLFARQIQEKCQEQNKDFYIAFIALITAIDSINREAIWNVQSRFGCPTNFITILRLLHDKMTATVLINGTDTELFTMRRGVKQGCFIAPTLFTIYLCAILFLVRDRLPCGVEIDYRLYGRLQVDSFEGQNISDKECRYRPSVC